jgi:carboxymethylenebutenolidase
MDYIQRYLVEEFVDDYSEGHLSRRELVKRIGYITGTTVTASLLTQLGVPDEVAHAADVATVSPDVVTQMVAPDDPDLTAEMVTFPGDGAELMGYLARPAAEGSRAGVMLVSDNRALSSYTMDVTRRLAKAGFAALAVDLVSREGGTAAVEADDPSKVPGILGSAGPARHVSDLSAGVTFLQAQPFVRPGGLGVVGFCFGGGIAWLLATSNSAIIASAPFYGPIPSLDVVPNLNGPITLFYGQTDTFVNPGIPGLVKALMDAKKVWSMFVYAGAPHAFHNDTTPNTYRPGPAADAWAKTLELFNSALPSA